MRAVLSLLVVSCLAPLALAADTSADFRPDPRSVRRHGAAYRYPQAGWIVLHVEGEPYERGFQHGALLAEEIVGYVKCFAALNNSKAPAEGWKTLRTLVNALFVRRFDREFLEEMQGIADGASKAGAKFDERPLDLVDIVTINCWAEIETLDAALEATPTGLEGLHFPRPRPRALPPVKPMHCSAFAATGPATADGKIVFGHVTMFDLYPALFFNVWLDVQPAKGQRIVMQSYPGGIQSGMDYYINSAGLLLLETTIAQTRFDLKGQTVASRTRKALQYADNIDAAVAILQKDNNGLYTNEWMLGDIKTNEIAVLELGTTRSKLYRSSKNEWYGGTPGFYWGCNNAKDLQVRLDTVASVEGRPANLVFKPADRDKKWLELYARHKGKIDAEFGKIAFTTMPLCSASTIDAKYTTADLARQLRSWALIGPPRGKSWQPTDDEKQRFPEIRPLVSNPWALMHPLPPAKDAAAGPAIVDLRDQLESPAGGKADDRKQSMLRTLDRAQPVPAWHGTILPKADADIWLAAAFADYERIVALENQLHEQAKDGQSTAADRDRLALELFAHRSNYLAAARIVGDIPLSKTKAEIGRDEWYRIASGKGVLVLHELRRAVGDQAFLKLMDAFGRQHAGKEVSSEQFQGHVEKLAGERAKGFFDYWLNQTGLPSYALVDLRRDGAGKPGSTLAGDIRRVWRSPATNLDVVIETDNGAATAAARFAPESIETSFAIKLDKTPRRIVLDKYGMTAKVNGGIFSVLSFFHEPDKTLIVWGSGDEQAANRETAEALQESIRTNWCNCTVPLLSDKEVTDDELKSHHLLLIGRPDSNAVSKRFAGMLPITFGSRSFVVRNEAYAHAQSGVIAATENPLNTRFAVTLLAGLSAQATTKLPEILMKKDQQQAEVIVLPYGGPAKFLTVPAKELVRELGNP